MQFASTLSVIDTHGPIADDQKYKVQALKILLVNLIII